MAEVENRHMKVKGMPPLVVDDAVMIAHEIHKVHEAIGDISINAEITTETGDIAQDATMQAINLTLETLVSGLAVLTQAVQSLDNEAEIDEIRAQIATIAGVVEDLTELSHTLGKDVSEIRNDIADTNETVSDLTGELATLNELLDSLREWAQNVDTKMEEIDESLAGIDSEIVDIKEMIAALSGGSEIGIKDGYETITLSWDPKYGASTDAGTVYQCNLYQMQISVPDDAEKVLYVFANVAQVKTINQTGSVMLPTAPIIGASYGYSQYTGHRIDVIWDEYFPEGFSVPQGEGGTYYNADVTVEVDYLIMYTKKEED